MVHMPSTDYSDTERGQLLGIARDAMTHAAQTGEPYRVETDNLPVALTNIRCSFVTLRKSLELRGCTGSLEPTKPLAVDVAQATWRTALSDPRFAPVKIDEVNEIHIEISVLSPLTEFAVSDEADLLARLQPGIDGLVLEAGRYRSTFLPKVWEHLPDPRDFVEQLKLKAGLAPSFWSEEIQLFRYHTETFGENEPA